MVVSSMAMSLDTIVGVNTEGEQIPLTRVLDARTEMQDWLKAKLTTGVCAKHLVCELAGHWCRMPQMFGAVPLLIDCHAVLDQIGSLEKVPRNRAARTKPATEFPTGPLKGLWHKHWFQASFIPTNLLLENEKNGDALLYRALAKRYLLTHNPQLASTADAASGSFARRPSRGAASSRRDHSAC